TCRTSKAKSANSCDRGAAYPLGGAHINADTGKSCCDQKWTMLAGSAMERPCRLFHATLGLHLCLFLSKTRLFVSGYTPSYYSLPGGRSTNQTTLGPVSSTEAFYQERQSGRKC